MLLQVDIDSTLYDLDKLICSIADEAGINWPRKDNCWKLPEEISHYDGTPCTRDDVVKLFRKAHSREVVAEQKPYPFAAATIASIVSDFDNIEVAYVSDRHEQAGGALEDWLEQEGFLHEHAQVLVTKDKRHWMREHRPEVVIDDRVRTMLMARFELDATVISLQHNHNVNLRREVDGIYIVPSWKDINQVLREEVLPESPLLSTILSRS